MSSHHFLNSLCNIFFPCLNFLSTSFGASNYQNQESSTIELLPNSVILEILLKLSVKSIITCKCVCKSWHDLISDPSFATTCSTNPPQFSAIVWSDHRTVTNPLDDVSFGFVEIGAKDEFLSVPFNPKALDFPKNGIVGIPGSCNGFVCLVKSPQLGNESDGDYVDNRDSIYNNQNVYVVSPILGECIELPRVRGAEHIRDVVYGFGVGTSSNEYKVIRIVIRYELFDLLHEIKVFGEIFTVGVDQECRCFEDNNIPCYIYPCGVTLNGVLHWIGYNRRFGVVYAFDIGEERGECFSLPPGLGDEPSNVILAVWDGQLCLTDNSSEVQVDVWTMKKYGVVESWTRDIILRRWIPRELRPHPLIPITMLRKGELLLSRPYRRSLISYDPKTKKCRKLVGSHVEGTVSFLFGYAPSFFSLRNAFKTS